MKNLHLLLFFFLAILFKSHGQTGKEFWFVAPEVTSAHNDRPIVFRLATSDSAASVTVSMPANPSFTPITVGMGANSSQTIDLTPFIDIIENKPANTILTNGLFIKSTQNITAYYEVNNSNNNEFFSLKGESALGTEFYTPFQNFFDNANFNPPAYAAFDIVATEDNTTILIYPTTAIIGHNALTSFTITLNKGQTWSGANPTALGINNPAGTIITSNKPIAVTVKSDSDGNPIGSCLDLEGDQIVPTDIIGKEYIAVKSGVNNERVFILATQNNTSVSVNGVATTTLFGSETYDLPLNDPFTYITATKPVYVYHLSGFGCELGAAILPPLNCAGSQQLSFVRSTSEFFGLNLLVKNGAQGGFTLNGSPSIIKASDFSVVPGTSGIWVAARISFNTTDIPVGTANLISNSIEVFSMGMINGGATSGARFGYFSEFKAPIKVDAGVDQSVCANNLVYLAGTVKGGASTGVWTTNGSGTFQTTTTNLNGIYKPSAADVSAGNITFTLTSTSICFPEEDQVKISFTPAPTIVAGSNQSICANNPGITLNGKVTISFGGVWSGGAGTFVPNLLNAAYTPTAAEINSGKIILKVTSTGNGNCLAVSDSLYVLFTPAPTVNAGSDQSICVNKSDVQLNGSVTEATGGAWTGGAGTYTSSSAILNAIYKPTPAEISGGNLVLTLNTTGFGNCLPVAATVKIFFTPAPVVSAGSAANICSNNSVITLNGSASSPATGLVWSGGNGGFSPSNTVAGAVYTPTTAELLAGNVNLVATSTNNGNCNAVSNNVTYTFTPAPTINAGSDIQVCENKPAAQLNAISLSVATGIIWTGGMGSFNPGNTALDAVYTPDPTEIENGEAILTITTTGNGNCNSTGDQVKIIIAPQPVVSAGTDALTCTNNPAFNLAGTMQNAGGVQWSGAGSFSPNSTTANATYTPTASEISSGKATVSILTTGNNNCNAVSDNMQITIIPAPIADAGSDQVVCENNPDVSLNGKMTVATGGQWTGGLGSFSPSNTDLNAIYTPTTSEISSGSVSLILNSTGNGNCNAVSDFVKISFTQAPSVNAGFDADVCANKSKVALNGNVKVATGGIWSGGSGVFSPDNTSPSADYQPSPAEILAGNISLGYTSTGNGKCKAVSDIVLINIAPSPVVNSGSDLSSCINNPSVTLSGSVQNAGGGTWSGGSGIFNPGISDLNATYIPSQVEINSGFVNLVLSSTKNGTCNPVTDALKIIINPAPQVNAGSDVSVCSNNAVVKINGIVTNATGGIWSGGLGIFSPDNNSLSGTYTPTASEISKGVLTLALNSSGNGNCNSVSDDFTIQFTASPSVSSGGSQSVCANNAGIALNASVTIAAGGIWSGGAGSFSPDNSSLKPTYTPTAAEVLRGNVQLTFTSTGNANCKAVSDVADISITPAPSVNAGADQTICVDKKDVSLSGFVSGKTSTGKWTTGGSGSFVPGNTVLNGSYQLSSLDSVKGKVLLVLSSTNNGNCKVEADSLEIFVLPAGNADAGADLSVCANNANINLSGKVGGGATTGVWTSSGKGTFLPDNKSLNIKYIPSRADTISGLVTLTLTANSCSNASDEAVITIYPAASPDAGTDKIVCVSDLAIPLNGKINGASGSGTWSTNGSGSFIPDNTKLDAIYQASKGDSLNKNIILTLTTSGTNNCKAVVDTLNIRITSAGTADAGPDQTLCENNSEVELSGSVGGGADAGIWTSSGSGQFSPSRVEFAPAYIPSGNDLSVGKVTLTFTSNSCDKALDDVKIFFTKTPDIDAGPDQQVCSNNASVKLSATFAGQGIWSSHGSGKFSPGTGNNVTYTPGNDELTGASFFLYFSSSASGKCKSISDSVKIAVILKPIVSAGSDMTVCRSSQSAALHGTVDSDFATGMWKTLGSGIFIPNASSEDVSYVYGSSDTILGYARLVLVSVNNEKCYAESDTVTINFGNTVSVSAGDAITICATEKSVPLSGFVSGGSETGIWETKGSGTFFPNTKELESFYKVGSGDADKGTLELILTSTDNGKCKAGKDTLHITFVQPPPISAGVDKELCKGTKSITLYDANAAGNEIRWSSPGSGAFVDPANKNTDYVFSKSDSIAGSVTLTIKLINSVCSVNDAVKISFGGKSFADAGADQSVCSGQSKVDLKGFISGQASKGKWSTLGTGNFISSDTSLVNSYQLSKGDSLNQIVKLVLTSVPTNGCAQDVDTIFISRKSSIILNAGQDTSVCTSNKFLNLQAKTSEPYNIKWHSKGNGLFYPSDTTKFPEYIFGKSDSIAGKTVVYITAIGKAGCLIAPDSMLIQLSSPTVPGFDYFDACADAVVKFRDTSTLKSGESRKWNFGDNTYSNLKNPSHQFSVVSNNKVSLTVTTTIGCIDSIQKLISIKPSPKAGFKVTSDEFKIGEEIGFADLSEGSKKWKWYFGDNSDSAYQQQPSHVFLKAGTFRVHQVVINEFDCSDTSSMEVVVKGNIVLPPKLPNAFSPNGDGNNDVFVVRGGPFLDVDFRIYNVWGEIIFETLNPAEGWDGNYKGVKQPMGVYIYTISATTQDGKKYSRSGDVTLIK